MQGQAKAFFTLTELLVVITIVAILASLLMPVAMKAMIAGRTAFCQNNQRQYWMGLEAFAEDYQDRYPRWWSAISIYPSVGSSTPMDEPDLNGAWSNQLSDFGILPARIMNTLACPLNPYPAYNPNPGDGMFGKYAFGGSCSARFVSGTGYVRVYRSRIRKPSQYLIFSDAPIIVSATPQRCGYYVNAANYLGYQFDFHPGIVATFVDGHQQRPLSIVTFEKLWVDPAMHTW